MYSVVTDFGNTNYLCRGRCCWNFVNVAKSSFVMKTFKDKYLWGQTPNPAGHQHKQPSIYGSFLPTFLLQTPHQDCATHLVQGGILRMLIPFYKKLISCLCTSESGEH